MDETVRLKVVWLVSVKSSSALFHSARLVLSERQMPRLLERLMVRKLDGVARAGVRA